MNSFKVLLLILILTATSVHAASLDEYYLRMFRLSASARPVATGLATQSDAAPVRCRTWLYHDLRRDWGLLEPQTQKILAKVLPARPVLADQATVVSSGGHFTVHYATSGSDAPPSLAWVNTVAQTFENAYSQMVVLGYRPAPTLSGVPYDVYLKNVGTTLNEFGETASDVPVTSTSYTSYMIIDNDFSSQEFGNQITNYTPEKALQITAAHEYHHAIQYGYNLFFDSWYAEATSTWIEDEIYDDVNQLYNYLPDYMRNTDRNIDIAPDVSLGGGYGRWIFNRHLAERFGITVVRDVWDRLATMAAPANINSDIPMLPVIDVVLNGKGSSLSDEFFLFTKKTYTRNWTTHTDEINLIHPVIPKAVYSTFPVNSSSTDAPTVTLPRYAFAYYLFQPASSAPSALALSVAHESGIRTTGFRKGTGDVIAEFPPDGTGLITIPSFTSGTVEAALLVTNSNANDDQTANFSTDNSTAPPATAPVASGDGGGGGCFIATAAFGSYLHPKVQILRTFRDEYLLRSPPGRAFVKLYYRLSPPIADVVSRHEGLRTVFRVLLTPVIVAVEYPRLAAVVLAVGGIGGILLIYRDTALRSRRSRV